jgi:hypothetical protein
MPVVPVGPTAPYDIVDSVLNTTRTRVNDAIVSLGGEVLTDNQPFTQEMTNTGWRKFQSFLANKGMSRFRKRCLLSGFPVVGTQDPASETLLNWSFFYDGVSYFFPGTAKPVQVLPQDFIQPLTVGERITGTNATFTPMSMASDGMLPDWRKRGWNGWWDWRDDGLYMPGSLYSMDLQIYYAAFLPDFTTQATLQWYQQPVPVMRCKSALANYIAAEFAAPRGDMDAATFIAQAEQDARLNFNVDVRAKQRVNVSRRGFSGRNRGDTRGGSGFGY